MNSVPDRPAENAPREAGCNPTELPDDPRLMQAVQEFLGELEAGHRPNRQDFLHRYPDLAGPLAQCLDGLELVHRATPWERQPAPALANTARAPSEILPANPLGDFQIVREIGRGGMGIVYEAVQLSLGRRVALKVLPFAATFDAKHLQRFHKEAQAAAQLHHTNIVPVYAVGCERGVHFYAMQLIEGQSLALVIRQIRQQAGLSVEDESVGPSGQPKNVAQDQPTVSDRPLVAPGEKSPDPETVSQVSMALSTQHSRKREEFFRTAARFIVQAAEALEHAHQVGIVHRDIKPANLLLDGQGRLWVTDFGLAQFHAEAGVTQTGDILGTLRYMSPEQASGQRLLLDHRTDVYSLGATLYELATLEPIFPGRNRQELLHQISNDEPRAPRALERTVPVELETIILKAVSKSPADRYSSAHELAADLQRYLEDKPILAKRPSLVERTRKWSRRHPSLVVAGVLLLLVGMAGLVINNRMIAHEQAKTAAALEREKQRAEEAEKRFRQAREAVDLLVQVSEEELANHPFLETVRQRLLEAALDYYQDFIDQQSGDAASQAELTAGKDRVRRILDELSTIQGAHRFDLVSNPAVQADLRLSDKQRAELAKLGPRWSEQRRLPGGPRLFGPAKGRQQMLVLARENEKALSGILDAQQRQRLRQIALQSQGPLAFQEPQVIEALRLTAEQKKRIRAIKVECHGEMPPRPDAEDEWKEHARKREVEQILVILTPEQSREWQELTGERFQGAIRLPPPGPFGPPRGPAR